MKKPSRSRTWLSIAAGIVLLAGFLKLLQPGPEKTRQQGTVAKQTEEVRLTSTMQATGFRPVAEGAITVIKGDRQQ